MQHHLEYDLDFLAGRPSGLRIAPHATGKLGFFGATPAAQPAAGAQAPLAAQAQSALTHAVGTADGTVADVGAAFNQTTLNDNFKEVTSQLANARADIANLRTLLAEVRSVLVVLGLMKGSA